MTDAGTPSDRFIDRMGSYPGAAPEIGVWLWAMQEVRRNLLDTLERVERAGFGQEFLDWRGPDGDDNSVGTLLYHVAGVELGWLYHDILGTGFPEDIGALFPLDDRTEDGRLRPLPGVTLAEHRERLARSRERFLEIVSPLTVEEWHELKYPPDEEYAMSPAWTVFHLVEHEAGHLYEVRRMARKWLGKGRR